MLPEPLKFLRNDRGKKKEKIKTMKTVKKKMVKVLLRSHRQQALRRRPRPPPPPRALQVQKAANQ
jgi:hypothetical protein